MKDPNEISDDEIRILGEQPKPEILYSIPVKEEDEVNFKKSIAADKRPDETKGSHAPRHKKGNGRTVWIIVAAIAIIAAIGIAVWALTRDRQDAAEPEPALFEPEVQTIRPAPLQRLSRDTASSARAYTEMLDTTVNDIPIRLYIPHNATMTLHVGRMDKSDTTVIFTAQAADVRADNGGIVGAFVLAGKPLAWGLSKDGYCASIDGKVTIGVAENSPLFEEATERGGYFFRQYPLVGDGQLIENNPKGKAIRRGICDRAGEIFMAETMTAESLHDFAQALVDIGTDQAVYLVGSSAYGWAVDEHGTRHEFGDENKYKYGRRRMPANISYIVWCSGDATPTPDPAHRD